MKLIIVALIILAAWALLERVISVKWPEPYGPTPGEQEAAKLYYVFTNARSMSIKTENRRRFLRELEDFCLDEGLDLKVFEDFEFNALGIRLHDKKTNRSMQARVKREDYEGKPIASANRIKRAWEGGNNGYF